MNPWLVNSHMIQFRFLFWPTVTARQKFLATKQSKSQCSVPVGKAQELTRLALKILQFASIVNGFKGDSGGPLTIEENGIHTLAGITSHGFSTKHVKVEFKQTGIPHTTSILTMITRESSKQTMILILCGKRKFENIELFVPFTIWYEETFYMLKIGLKKR